MASRVSSFTRVTDDMSTSEGAEINVGSTEGDPSTLFVSFEKLNSHTC